MDHISLELADSPETPRTRKPWWKYLIAIGSVLAAFGIRYWLSPMLGEEMPFMLFIAAALVATWCGGTVMGVVALLLGLFLSDSFFLKSGSAPIAVHSLEVLRLLRYLFTASLGIVLIEVQHRGQLRTQAALAELRREVARRKLSEQALLEAKEQLGRFAGELEAQVVERTSKLMATVGYLQGLLYHIGHNLRAPLRAMSGYTTCLVEEYGRNMDETARAYATHISEASRRMDAMIDGLLDYGRLGHIEVTLMNVQLDRAVHDVLYNLAFQIETRKAVVKVLSPLPEIRADADLVEQVLTNLVENALTFVSPSTIPQVQIRAEQRGSIIRLWIEDNGIGIEPRHHERIFGVFQTLQPVRGVQGDGIGLAIVKQAVERMGGKVGLESQLGAGSRFWVEFAVGSNVRT